MIQQLDPDYVVRMNGILSDIHSIDDDQVSEHPAEVKNTDISANTSCSRFLLKTEGIRGALSNMVYTKF
jgi:hypothetical protein